MSQKNGIHCTRVPLLLVLLAGFSLLGGCFVPPTAIMQGAPTTDPGKFRITPHYSSVRETGEDADGKLADQYGALIGLGAGERVEVQLLFDRIKVVDSDSGYNFTSVGPKFELVENSLAFVIPAGFYWGSEIDFGETFQIHPSLIASLSSGNKARFSVGARYIFAPNDGMSDFLTGSIIGEFSNDLSRWAIIPEVGMTWEASEIDESSSFMNFSIGFALFTP